MAAGCLISFIHFIPSLSRVVTGIAKIRFVLEFTSILILSQQFNAVNEALLNEIESRHSVSVGTVGRVEP